MTQYIYGDTGMVSYDDERSICDKTEYAQFHGLNGYIIWELSGDLMPDLSTPLLDAANAKLLDPDLNCASFDVSDSVIISSDASESSYVLPDSQPVISEPEPSEWSQPVEIISTSATVVSTPATSPTITTVTATNNVDSVTDKFFPVFVDGTTLCQTGTVPSSVQAWMAEQDLKDTMMECCASYSLPGGYENCLKGGSSSDDTPYYPKFRATQCISDGVPPSWMAGDYLTSSSWDCCQNSFLGSKLDACLMNSGWDVADDSSTASLIVQDTEIVTTTAATTTMRTTATTTTSTTTTTKSIQEESPQSNSGTAAVVELLQSYQNELDNKILLYETPSMTWEASIYRANDMVEAIYIMATEGVAGKHLYLGDGSNKGHVYGLVNLAAFLAQAMKETIIYNACDENSWDAVGGGYPLSNSCGQLGQSYQDYHCSDHEKHMECPVKKEMEITATTNAKWWGAPAPLFCGPKEKYPFTGFWDHSYNCDDPWANPPLSCDTYEGQKGGGFNHDAPHANSAGHTDVEGCCWCKFHNSLCLIQSFI